MKSKALKRFLSIILTVILTMVVMVPGMADAETNTGYQPTDVKGSITLVLPTNSDVKNLEGMHVDAYQILQQVKSTISNSINYVPTKKFENLFKGTKSAYAKIIDKAENDTTIDIYVYYANNCLVVSESKDNHADAIKISNAVINDAFFESRLLEAILGEADNAGIAANAKTVSKWVSQYVSANKTTVTADREVTATVKAGETAVKEIEIGKDQNGNDDLSFGYWVLISSNAPDGVANVEAVMKLTEETGAENENNVKAKLKLEEQTIDKLVKKDGEDDEDYRVSADAGVGEKLNYKVEFPLQDLTDYKYNENDENKKYTFKFTDTMNNQKLIGADGNAVVTGNEAYNKGVFKVTFTKDTISKVYTDANDTNLDLSTILKDNGSDYGKYENKQQTFSLDFDVTKLKGTPNNIIGKGWTVTIEYSTVLTEDAVTKISDNNAKWEYSNNPDKASDKGTLTDETKVYTYGLDITKKFSGNVTNKILFDKVTFKLYKAVDGKGEDAGKMVKSGAALKFVDADGSYTYNRSDTTTAENADQIKPNPEGDKVGNFRIEGLAPGYYILTEDYAGIDYSAAGEILIYIYAEADNAGVYAIKDGSYAYEGRTEKNNEDDGATLNATVSSDGTHLVFDVLNTKSFNFPSTGGIGSWMLTFAGVLLAAIGISIFCLLRKRA